MLNLPLVICVRKRRHLFGGDSGGRVFRINQVACAKIELRWMRGCIQTAPLRTVFLHFLPAMRYVYNIEAEPNRVKYVEKLKMTSTRVHHSNMLSD